MPSIVLTNLSEELHRRLVQEARRRGRSPDQEVIELLDRALPVGPGVVMPTPIVPLRPISEQEIRTAIAEGRE